MSKPKHGLSQTRLYSIYSGMLSRIKNPKHKKYKNYGARGIIICDEWLVQDKGFLNFYKWANENGYSDSLTLDRIDVNGNYEPENCRRITNKKQQNNRTNNIFIEYNGNKRTVSEWSELLGIPKNTILHRLKQKWDTVDVLSKPGTVKKDISRRYITYRGKTQSITEWSKETGIDYFVLHRRLSKGWDIERTLTSPVEKKYSAKKRS